MKRIIVLMATFVLVFGMSALNICYAKESSMNEQIGDECFKTSECVTVSNNKELLQFEKIKELHQQMYWTKNWSEEKICKNIDNSTLCYGAYDGNGNQIGFARVVTDFSTVSYILDVVVDESHRNAGVGAKLMNGILENEDLKDCSFVLAASTQAKNFYQRLGFQIKNDKYMVFRVS